MAIVEHLEPSETGRRRLGLRSPANLESVGEIEVANAEDVHAAVARARAAQPAWAAKSIDERAALIRRAQEVLMRRQDDIVATVRRETGKTETEAFMFEVFASCDSMTYWSKRAKGILAERKRRMHLLSPLKKLRIGYRPLGVVGIITPWNGPFVLGLNPTVQALVAGNSVVLKPSEVTPYSGALVGEIFEEAGLPAGVLEVLLGDGETGAALLEADINKVSFTGSVATGRKVGEVCGRRLIPCTLELGGKDPFIVCEDADLERASAGALYGACVNTGQVCMAAERFYVVESVADEFTRLVKEKAKALRQGDGAGCDIGAMFHEPQLAIIERHIEDAKAKGANVLCGGRRNPDLKGLFYEPTVLTDVTQDMDVVREETFGPILPIIRVKDEEEAIRLANDTNYGLTASVWTRDENKGIAYGRRLEAGSIIVNDSGLTYGALEAPFGGVKDSGVGRVNGEEGLRGFCYAQPIIADRFQRKTEDMWYPITEDTLAGLKKALKFLWQTPIGRLIS
jgi:succinate-semialdehyde dehydrogenase/glutarate-semialdehyde dehydrogenase